MSQPNLKECKVLVTATTFGVREPRLRSTLEDMVGEVRYNPFGRPLKAEELRGMVGDVDGLIAGVDEVTESVMDAAPRLKVIARYGVGVDKVDLDAATRRGIVVTNTPGANSSAVAELAVGLMIALARGICGAARQTREGAWPRCVGMGLKGKTVGLVGLGRIGREVTRRLIGFGCKVVAFDPAVGEEEMTGLGVKSLTLEELLASSDIVSLHVPLLPSTEKMVNQGFLSRMKKGALLINTARGELIDEVALEKALRGGHLAGAALDCLCEEPPPADHPMLKMSQVIITPHMGAHTDEAMEAMGWMAIESCIAVLEGKRPQYVVNPQVYARRL